MTNADAEIAFTALAVKATALLTAHHVVVHETVVCTFGRDDRLYLRLDCGWVVASRLNTGSARLVLDGFDWSWESACEGYELRSRLTPSQCFADPRVVAALQARGAALCQRGVTLPKKVLELTRPGGYVNPLQAVAVSGFLDAVEGGAPVEWATTWVEEELVAAFAPDWQ